MGILQDTPFSMTQCSTGHSVQLEKKQGHMVKPLRNNMTMKFMKFC